MKQRAVFSQHDAWEEEIMGQWNVHTSLLVVDPVGKAVWFRRGNTFSDGGREND